MKIIEQFCICYSGFFCPNIRTFLLKFGRFSHPLNLYILGFPDGVDAAAKSLQSCLTLYDPIDGSPPGSPVPGILQARTLEWVAISFSNAWKWKVKGKSLSRVQLFATLWTVAYQAPQSMGFSRQEYWNGLPFPFPGDLPNPGIEPGLPHCRQTLYHLSYQGSHLPNRRYESHRFNPWVWKVPWRKAWQPTPVFLPGESHGHRSLSGYSPWGHTKSWTEAI